METLKSLIQEPAIIEALGLILVVLLAKIDPTNKLHKIFKFLAEITETKK